VGNVGKHFKKFCSRPLRCRDLWSPALPGAIDRKQTATRPSTTNLTEPYIVVLWWGAMWAVSTRPAGSLAMTMWPCGHDHARAFVDNVDNVVTCFKSLAKPWGVSIRELYNLLYSYLVLQQQITSSVSFKVVHIVHNIGFSLLNPVNRTLSTIAPRAPTIAPTLSTPNNPTQSKV
jgi:hypothetical protein